MELSVIIIFLVIVILAIVIFNRYYSRDHFIDSSFVGNHSQDTSADATSAAATSAAATSADATSAAATSADATSADATSAAATSAAATSAAATSAAATSAAATSADATSAAATSAAATSAAATSAAATSAAATTQAFVPIKNVNCPDCGCRTISSSRGGGEECTFPRSKTGPVNINNPGGPTHPVDTTEQVGCEPNWQCPKCLSCQPTTSATTSPRGKCYHKNANRSSEDCEQDPDCVYDPRGVGFCALRDIPTHQAGTPAATSTADPSVATVTPTTPTTDNSEMIDGLLGQPHEDNIAKFFSALDGEYSMYGTGAPINGSRTLQAGTRFKQRELPPCLKDRYKVSKPLSVEGSGSPAKPDYFSGIGTVLPKFAYKNVYNPNEPRNVKDKELKDRVYNLGEPLDNYLVSAKDVRPDYMTGIIRPTKEDLYKDSPKCVKNVYSISKPVEIVTGGLPQNVYHYSETDKKLPEFAYNDN